MSGVVSDTVGATHLVEHRSNDLILIVHCVGSVGRSKTQKYLLALVNVLRQDEFIQLMDTTTNLTH
jgi:hypothetical protein